MEDKFWIYNPYIIIQEYYKLNPVESSTRIDQLNIFTRILFFLLIIFLLFSISDDFVLLFFLGIIAIVLLYFIYKNNNKSIYEDLIDENKMNQDKFENMDNNLSDTDLIDNSIKNIYDSTKDKIFKNNNENKILESGYIDFNGNYKIGKDNSDINIDEYEKEQKEKNKKISYEKYIKYKDEKGRKPTKENPFTNIVFSDYLDASNLALPCNTDQKDVEKEMQNLYNSTIYRNLEDVWERENSQRLFYTMPIQTIPNDQTNFANWLYKTGPTCHENTEYCTYYESPNMTSQKY